MKTTRLGKLIFAIEEYSDNHVYYDDDTDTEVIDGTEEDMYNTIMQNEGVSSAWYKDCSFMDTSLVH